MASIQLFKSDRFFTEIALATTERSRLGGAQMKSVLNAMEQHKQETEAAAGKA